MYKRIRDRYFSSNSNKKLENIFLQIRSNNYSMLTEWYKDHSGGLTPTQIFREHYKKMKPSLDLLKENERQKLHSIRKTKKFVEDDLISLFTQPYSKKTRELFYKSLEPTYPEIPKIRDFNEALSSIGQPRQNLLNAGDYFHDHPRLIQQAFEKSRYFRVENHESYNTSLELMISHFSELSNSQLDVLSYYATKHEEFTLVTLEPYMVFILGNALFFNLFVPLHREYGASTFVNEAIDGQVKLRNTFHSKFTRFSSNCEKYSQFLHPALRAYGAQGGTTGILLGALGYFYSYIIKPNVPMLTPDCKESRVVRDLVDNSLTGEGLDSARLDAVRDKIGKFSFEAGKSLGTISRNFGAGIFSPYENSARLLAEQADRALDKTSEVKKDLNKS